MCLWWSGCGSVLNPACVRVCVYDDVRERLCVGGDVVCVYVLAGVCVIGVCV